MHTYQCSGCGGQHFYGYVKPCAPCPTAGPADYPKCEFRETRFHDGSLPDHPRRARLHRQNCDETSADFTLKVSQNELATILCGLRELETQAQHDGSDDAAAWITKTYDDCFYGDIKALDYDEIDALRERINPQPHEPCADTPANSGGHPQRHQVKRIPGP